MRKMSKKEEMYRKKLAALIKEKREDRGLTQERLGEILSISNNTISRYENGDQLPNSYMLELICKELDIPFIEVLMINDIVRVYSENDETLIKKIANLNLSEQSYQLLVDLIGLYEKNMKKKDDNK